MLWAFFLLWGFGAVLVLTCCALVWSERVSVLRSVPSCAKCGYPLTGLSRSSRCPECGGTARRWAAPKPGERHAETSVQVWALPALFGMVAPTLYCAAAKIPFPENVVGCLGVAVVFSIAGVVLRVMMGWIALDAARALMWATIVALGAAMGLVLLVSEQEGGLATTPAESFVLAPLMIAPFAGYGLAGGIALVAWMRSRW